MFISPAGRHRVLQAQRPSTARVNDTGGISASTWHGTISLHGISSQNDTKKKISCEIRQTISFKHAYHEWNYCTSSR